MLDGQRPASITAASQGVGLLNDLRDQISAVVVASKVPPVRPSPITDTADLRFEVPGALRWSRMAAPMVRSIMESASAHGLQGRWVRMELRC